MRLDEFKRINLKVIKDDNIIYEGLAEELPDDMKKLITKEIKIQPNLAVIVAEEAIDEVEA